jgi:hypothetical protein
MSVKRISSVKASLLPPNALRRPYIKIRRIRISRVYREDYLDKLLQQPSKYCQIFYIRVTTT